MRNTVAIVVVLLAGGCGFSLAAPLAFSSETSAELTDGAEDQPPFAWQQQPLWQVMQFWSPETDDWNYYDYPSSNRLRRSTAHRPNLSITNQIDVLRHRLLLEMNRRRTEHQIRENKKILETLGKRRKRNLGSFQSKFEKLTASRENFKTSHHDPDPILNSEA